MVGHKVSPYWIANKSHYTVCSCGVCTRKPIVTVDALFFLLLLLFCSFFFFILLLFILLFHRNLYFPKTSVIDLTF